MYAGTCRRLTLTQLLIHRDPTWALLGTSKGLSLGELVDGRYGPISTVNFSEIKGVWTKFTAYFLSNNEVPLVLVVVLCREQVVQISTNSEKSPARPSQVSSAKLAPSPFELNFGHVQGTHMTNIPVRQNWVGLITQDKTTPLGSKGSSNRVNSPNQKWTQASKPSRSESVQRTTQEAQRPGRPTQPQVSRASNRLKACNRHMNRPTTIIRSWSKALGTWGGGS